LLAIFLTVNAVPFKFNKRATTFNPCRPRNGTYADPLTVAIQPDPVVSNGTAQFNVSGTLTKYNITAGKTMLGIGFGDSAKQPIGHPYNLTFDKSHVVGCPFSILASNVSVPTLPNSYIIAVIVGEPTGDPKNPYSVYGCALANERIPGIQGSDG
ncbi:11906_t:CDS:2, partial [Dentiscutata erythropus]